MSRYIDREALLEWIEAVDGCLADGTVTAPTLYAQMITDIKQFPTADVVEVRHGYWTFKNTTYCHYGCFCSVCGKKSGIGGIRENQLKPYCPNCGAKMDGERKD